jgi:SnoaL-like domain
MTRTERRRTLSSIPLILALCFGTVAGVIVSHAGLATAASSTVSRTDRLADWQSIYDAQACYGRAQDVVYRTYANEAKAKRDGLTAFGKCFTRNADISIRLLGGTELEHTHTLAAWVNFVYNFGQTNNYSATRHLIGNIQIRFTGPNTATVWSSGVNPHFIRGSSTDTPAPAIDWIIGNYKGYLVRTHAGWKINRFLINGDEFAHTPGSYPLGIPDGTGNIGFGDISTRP